MDVVEVSPPFDHAEVTAGAANRCVLEAISALAVKKRDGTPRALRAAVAAWPRVAGRGSRPRTSREAPAAALARLYDLDLADDPGDLDLYLALAARAGGPVLELMVGSGTARGAVRRGRPCGRGRGHGHGDARARTRRGRSRRPGDRAPALARRGGRDRLPRRRTRGGSGWPSSRWDRSCSCPTGVPSATRSGRSPPTWRPTGSRWWTPGCRTRPTSRASTGASAWSGSATATRGGS